VTSIGTQDPLAVAAVEAIHTGDLPRLKRLLAEHPDLATARLGDDDPDGMSCTLFHVATDWTRHFPNSPATVAALAEAGAEVNARFHGPHTERPLRWAASSNDVAVVDALLDADADIEAPGAVLGGGPPLADATGHARPHGSPRALSGLRRSPVARGDHARLLGRLPRWATERGVSPRPWCRAELDPAVGAGNTAGRGATWRRPELVAWLHGRGATSASELD
jgi:uncharacterized protein